MTADLRQTRPWIWAVPTIVLGGALGVAYIRLGGTNGPMDILAVIAVGILFWFNFRDRGKHRQQKRIGIVLVLTPVLIGVFSDLTRIRMSATLSPILMIAPPVGLVLAVWAYWADRKGHVTELKGG